jgi:K+-sensing histidine kinase KdpD
VSGDPSYDSAVQRKLGPYRDHLAIFAGIVVPLVVTAILVPLRSSIANTDVALVLVAMVVAVAANGDRLAGVLASVSAAAWFDFFFTRPYDRFSITRRADIETTVLLLVIGVAVTELAVRGRRQRETASRRAGYLNGIHDAAMSAAEGESPSRLVKLVTEELTEVLSLEACRFQPGLAGVGRPARLHHDGHITIGRATWDADQDGLPRETELLVESGGILRGRFLMTPAPDSHPDLERRLVSVALADQVGAALAGSGV